MTREETARKKRKVRNGQRNTFRLSDYRIPRQAFSKYDLVLTNEWATPCVVMPTYADGEMTDTGSRWCPKSATTSSWLLPSQTLIMAANQDALAWNHLLHFVRQKLPQLIPPILAAQAEWVDREYGQLLPGYVREHFSDTRLVLRAYAHNIETARNHFRDVVDGEHLAEHAGRCAEWMEIDGLSPTGPCPQQVWLLDRLLRLRPTTFVRSQIKIWRAADPWVLLPLACQLPEVGPDMEELGARQAWNLLWFCSDESQKVFRCEQEQAI